MKTMQVMRQTWRLYKQNFRPLMLMLLVQLILRAIALTPLMFLADKALAPLAYLAVPAYLLIALPARQNAAIAIRQMISGGSVFTTQLISAQDYGRKLLRGLKGTVLMLLWSAVTIAGVAYLVMGFTGAGGMDGLTFLRMFSSAGKVIGGDTMDGAVLIIGGVAATGILSLIGCAVHCGSRHAAALGDERLVKGRRGTLMGSWALGTLLLVPFAAALILILGDWAANGLEQFMKTFKFSAMAITGKQIGMMALAAIVLLLPVIPFRMALPAVCLQDKEDA